MKFDAKHFLKLFMMMLLCCTFLSSRGTSLASSSTGNHHTKITKVFEAKNFRTNPLIKFNLAGNNQEVLRQVHKVSNTVYTPYLASQSINICIRHFNYFSGYNDHRYTLQSTDFLFPFHGFW